ncbi:MAG: type I restriction enzyme HsdR N-terminal domain-containing protein [Bacteroidales bacterium]|nr:type I restriction enzyme HsdR N-terminal domain-containing protein [Bacteroidales bacterium]MDD3200931.1 type I restriction enzyme HsdR N-terminal domain-containing protein [Bacteroidales bacterium]
MEIFDPLRKKNVKGTPEEEVRQNIIRWLNTELKVPISLMCSEYGFVYNGRHYRADVVVFDRNPKPVMFVECKAPSVVINQSVVDQVIRYNKVLKVKYILISNGKTTYLCAWNDNSGRYEYTSHVPTYDEMLLPDKND